MFLNLSRNPAQLLVTFNADLNVQDNKGNTALHYSIAFNNLAVMKLLVEKGASFEIKNHKVMILGILFDFFKKILSNNIFYRI